jgi:hypothetical protein
VAVCDMERECALCISHAHVTVCKRAMANGNVIVVSVRVALHGAGLRCTALHKKSHSKSIRRLTPMREAQRSQHGIGPGGISAGPEDMHFSRASVPCAVPLSPRMSQT